MLKRLFFEIPAMLNKWSFLIYVLILVPVMKGYAGEKYQHMFISAQFHSQYIWRHYEKMAKDIQNYTHAVEINMGWKTAGSSPWHSIYNYPSYGFGFFYGNLNNPDLFGIARSGFLFTEFVFGQQRAIDHRMKVSLGLAHLSAYYDPVENPHNLNIGTPVNMHFNLNYSWFFSLNDHMLLAPGLSFTHFSNGALKKPNRGINLFDVNLSFRYKTEERNMNGLPDLILHDFSSDKKHRFFVNMSAGVMQCFIDGPNYKVLTISMNHTIQTRPGGRWGLGLDTTYDDYSKERIDRDNDDPKFVDYTRVGAFVSHDLLFDRLDILLNLGVYLYYGYKPDSKTYPRVGLRYEVDEHFNIQLALKAYNFRANHIQWGFGFSF